MGEKIREKAEGGKKFAELCGKWVNPAAYSHMFLGELQDDFF